MMHRTPEEIAADEVMGHIEFWTQYYRSHFILDHLTVMHKLRDQALFINLVHWDYKSVVCCWSNSDADRLYEMQTF